ncbi:XRE family transcriptional regulator (plasmid) [Marinobacter sp. NP-4(2019)]|nr:XRE family transcriptional regulator [Marinobacter sp. NP-4(2019)]
MGNMIRQRRKSLNIKTQKELAIKAHVHRERVNQIENDKYTGRLTDLERVLAVLGMELSAKVIDRPTLETIHLYSPMKTKINFYLSNNPSTSQGVSPPCTVYSSQGVSPPCTVYSNQGVSPPCTAHSNQGVSPPCTVYD